MPTHENALRYIPEHTGKRLEFVGWCMFWIALVAGCWTTYYFGELPDLGSALSGRPGRTFRSWQLTGLRLGHFFRSRNFIRYCEIRHSCPLA